MCSCSPGKPHGSCQSPDRTGRTDHIDWDGGFLLYLDYGDEECEVELTGEHNLITEVDGLNWKLRYKQQRSNTRECVT